MPNPNGSTWIKWPGLFPRDELQQGAMPMDPLLEYLILPDRHDHRGQPLFAVYFRKRRPDKDGN